MAESPTSSLANAGFSLRAPVLWGPIRWFGAAVAGTCRVLLRHWRLALILLAGGGAALWMLVSPGDSDLMSVIRGPGKPSREKLALAETIGSTGDWLGFNLVVFAVFWLLGHQCRRTLWKDAAYASIAAVVVAGLLCNLLRPTLGRPRPSTAAKLKVEAGFHPGMGFARGHAFQSFPSAHTTTSFATATTILIICPPAGIPLVAFAGAVGWARMVQNSHHPSDVAAGALLGCLVGSAAGLWVRRRRHEKTGIPR